MAKTRTTLYITRETWNDFLMVCSREGESASQKVEEFIDKYLSVHGPGNPQTTLEHAGLPKTLPHWKTCHFSSKELDRGLFKCIFGGIYMIDASTCDRKNGNMSCYREE